MRRVEYQGTIPQPKIFAEQWISIHAPAWLVSSHLISHSAAQEECLPNVLHWLHTRHVHISNEFIHFVCFFFPLLLIAMGKLLHISALFLKSGIQAFFSLLQLCIQWLIRHFSGWGKLIANEGREREGKKAKKWYSCQATYLKLLKTRT